jgi:hypothetical protein
VSALEDTLALQIRAAGLPTPERELRFIPGRLFRADFAWPDRKVWCDVQGGQWIGGHHSRGSTVEGDAEKVSLASILGWRPVIVTTSMVNSGKALDLIQRALSTDERDER